MMKESEDLLTAERGGGDDDGFNDDDVFADEFESGPLVRTSASTMDSIESGSFFQNSNNNSNSNSNSNSNNNSYRLEDEYGETPEESWQGSGGRKRSSKVERLKGFVSSTLNPTRDYKESNGIGGHVALPQTPDDDEAALSLSSSNINNINGNNNSNGNGNGNINDTKDEAMQVIRPGIPMIALDTQRGYGVTMVILYHFGYTIFMNAWWNISMFFSLSGFLITKTTVEAYERRGQVDILKFWAKRVSRLFPALLLMINLIALSQKLPYRQKHHNDGIRFQREGVDLIYSTIFATNINLVFNQVDDYFDIFTAPSVTRHLWTLSIEEQYYIIWPVLIWAITKCTVGDDRKAFESKRYVKFILIMDCFVMVGSVFTSLITIDRMGNSAAYLSTLCRMGDIAIGGFVYSCTRLWPSVDARMRSAYTDEIGRVIKPDPLTFRQKLLLEFGAFVGLVCISTMSTIQTPQDDLLTFYFHGARFGAIIGLSSALGVCVFAAEGPIPKWALCTKLWSSETLAFIGVMSYGLYLFHWPLIVYFGDPVGSHRKRVAMGDLDDDGSDDHFLLRDFGIYVTTMVLGYLSFALYEKPALILSRKTQPRKTIAVGFVAMAVTLFTIWAVTHNLPPRETFENDADEIFAGMDFGLDDVVGGGGEPASVFAFEEEEDVEEFMAFEEEESGTLTPTLTSTLTQTQLATPQETEGSSSSSSSGGGGGGVGKQQSSSSSSGGGVGGGGGGGKHTNAKPQESEQSSSSSSGGGGGGGGGGKHTNAKPQESEQSSSASSSGGGGGGGGGGKQNTKPQDSEQSSSSSSSGGGGGGGGGKQHDAIPQQQQQQQQQEKSSGGGGKTDDANAAAAVGVVDGRYTPIFTDISAKTFYRNLDHNTRSLYKVPNGKGFKIFVSEYPDYGPGGSHGASATVFVSCRTRKTPVDLCSHAKMWKSPTYWIWLESDFCEPSSLPSDFGGQEMELTTTTNKCDTEIVEKVLVHDTGRGNKGKTEDFKDEHVRKIVLKIDDLIPGVLNRNSVEMLRSDLEKPPVVASDGEHWNPIKMTMIGESVAQRIAMFWKESVQQEIPPAIKGTGFPDTKLYNLGFAGQPAIAYFLCLEQPGKYEECSGPSEDNTREKVMQSLKLTKPDVVVVHDSHWAEAKNGKSIFALRKLPDKVMAFNAMAREAEINGAGHMFFLTQTPRPDAPHPSVYYQGEMDWFLEMVDVLGCSEGDDSSIRLTVVNWARLTCPHIGDLEGKCSKEQHGFEDILPDGFHPFGDSGLWLTRTALAVVLDEVARHDLGGDDDGWSSGAPFSNPASAELLSLAPPDDDPPLGDLVFSYYICPNPDLKHVKTLSKEVNSRPTPDGDGRASYSESQHLVAE